MCTPVPSRTQGQRRTFGPSRSARTLNVADQPPRRRTLTRRFCASHTGQKDPDRFWFVIPSTASTRCRLGATHPVVNHGLRLGCVEGVKIALRIHVHLGRCSRILGMG
jgi:hypothetical protein